MESTIVFNTNGSGIWKAEAFDGTVYTLVPWGSLRRAFASKDGKWDGEILGFVGSIAEANRLIRHHEDNLPFSGYDEWTGLKVA